MIETVVLMSAQAEGNVRQGEMEVSVKWASSFKTYGESLEALGEERGYRCLLPEGEKMDLEELRSILEIREQERTEPAKKEVPGKRLVFRRPRVRQVRSRPAHRNRIRRDWKVGQTVSRLVEKPGIRKRREDSQDGMRRKEKGPKIRRKMRKWKEQRPEIRQISRKPAEK